MKSKPSSASCKSKLFLSTKRKLIRKEKKPACLSFDQVLDTSSSCHSFFKKNVSGFSCTPALKASTVLSEWNYKVPLSLSTKEVSILMMEEGKKNHQMLQAFSGCLFLPSIGKETKRILILSNKSPWVARGISLTVLQVFSFQVATSSSFADPQDCLSYLGLKMVKCEALLFVLTGALC